MARRRRRRHHRKGFGDYVSIPSLGGIKEYNPLGKSVNSTDLFVGGGIGLVGGAAVKYVYNMLGLSDKAPAFVTSYIGPISSLVAGIAAYMLQRKSKRTRATGHLVGATLVAAAPVAWNLLKQTAPQFFNDYVMVNPYGNAMGVLTADQGMSGFGVLTADGQAMSGYGADDDEFSLSAP